MRGVWEKAGDDDVFFMAGAIAFNVLVAFIPLALAVLGIAGTVLRMQDPGAAEVLMGYVTRNIPPVSAEFERAVGQRLEELIERSTSLLSVGSVFLLWVSTRLVATLRSVLAEIFDVHRDRGVVGGKLFDLKMVVAAGTLFTVNVGLTVALEVVARFGIQVLGLDGGRLASAEVLYGRVVAFLSIWVMFVLIYRYLPARSIRWGTAVVAATFTAVLFELMKHGFGWYVTNIADYRSTYEGLATLIILIFWIYYGAVVFILGGEVAHVFAMRRIRRRQKERLS